MNLTNIKIGIVGFGIVGQAIHHAFSKQNHTITYYDKFLSETGSLDQLVDTDCVFVCVPTDTVDQTCDVSVVESIVESLSNLKYSGLIIIKSTVIPGTTQRLMTEWPLLRLCFVPEFLRQEFAVSDFIDETHTLIVGTTNLTDFKFVEQLHYPYAHSAIQVSPTEAELTKYFVNNHNSMRITFANAYYEVCDQLGADYQAVLKAATTRPSIGHGYYLQCNDHQRGFSGKCLPKDLVAFSTLTKQLNLNLNLFDAIINDNTKFIK